MRKFFYFLFVYVVSYFFFVLRRTSDLDPSSVYYRTAIITVFECAYTSIWVYLNFKMKIFLWIKLEALFLWLLSSENFKFSSSSETNCHQFRWKRLLADISGSTIRISAGNVCKFFVLLWKGVRVGSDDCVFICRNRHHHSYLLLKKKMENTDS